MEEMGKSSIGKEPFWRRFLKKGIFGFFFHEEKKPGQKIIKEEPVVPAKVVIRCEAGEILQPANGRVIPRKEIPDEEFAAGILGEGVGVEPVDGVLVAPFDGVVSSVAEAKHALGIVGPGDMELLLHVGVDTVTMNGDGFKPLVEDGDIIEAGQKILLFDREKIRAAHHPDTVAVLLTNSDHFKHVVCSYDAPQ